MMTTTMTTMMMTTTDGNDGDELKGERGNIVHNTVSLQNALKPEADQEHVLLHCCVLLPAIFSHRYSIDYHYIRNWLYCQRHMGADRWAGPWWKSWLSGARDSCPPTCCFVPDFGF